MDFTMERLTKSWGLYEDINVSELTADAELENIINKSDMSLGADKNSCKKRRRSDSMPGDVSDELAVAQSARIHRIETPDKEELDALEKRATEPEASKSPEIIWQRMKQSYGLSPENVTESVHKAFVALSHSNALEVEKRFSEVHEKVENYGGYLFGIIRRFAAEESMAKMLADAGGEKSLSPNVQKALDSLRDKGYIDDSTIDLSLMSTLLNIEESQQLEILEKFSEVDISKINNKRAFLKGICRRYSDQSEKWSERKVRTAYASLHPCVFLCFEAAFRERKLDPRKISPRAIEKLRELPVHVAVQSVTKLQEADLSDVRNVTGFFLGIIKRHAEMAKKQSSMFAAVPTSVVDNDKFISPMMMYYNPTSTLSASYPPSAYVMPLGFIPQGYEYYGANE